MTDADHAAESGMTIPTEPVLFTTTTSAFCGPGSTRTMVHGVVHLKPQRHLKAGDVVDLGLNGPDLLWQECMANG